MSDGATSQTTVDVQHFETCYMHGTLTGRGHGTGEKTGLDSLFTESPIRTRRTSA